MKYSQTIVLGCLGAAALASAVPAPSQSTSLEQRSYEDDLLFLRDFFDEVLDTRALPAKKAATPAAKKTTTTPAAVKKTTDTSNKTPAKVSGTAASGQKHTGGKTTTTGANTHRTGTGANTRTGTGSNTHRTGTGANTRTGAGSNTHRTGTGANTHRTGTGANTRTGAGANAHRTGATGLNRNTAVHRPNAQVTGLNRQIQHQRQTISGNQRALSTAHRNEQRLDNKVDQLERQSALMKGRLEGYNAGHPGALPSNWARDLMDEADLFERDFEFDEFDARDFDEEDALAMRFIEDFEIDELD